MMVSVLDVNPVFARSLIVGVFGGISLVLSHMYTRRGPLIYPIYAAILFASTLVVAQYAEYPFGIRFTGVLLSLVVATAFGLARVMHVAAKRSQSHALAGKPPIPGGAPWWGMPVVLGGLVAASAGAAALVR